MKLSNILFTASILLLIACGNDSSESTEMLVGSWDLLQLNGDGTSTVERDGDVTETEIAVTSGDVNYVLTFSEGSYVVAGNYTITNEKTTASGAKVFTPVTYENATGNGSYAIQDNQIETGGPFIGILVSGVNLGTETQGSEYTIESLTDEELIVTSTEEKSISQADSTVTVLLDVRSVWTKR